MDSLFELSDSRADFSLEVKKTRKFSRHEGRPSLVTVSRVLLMLSLAAPDSRHLFTRQTTPPSIEFCHFRHLATCADALGMCGNVLPVSLKHATERAEEIGIDKGSRLGRTSAVKASSSSAHSQARKSPCATPIVADQDTDDYQYTIIARDPTRLRKRTAPEL